MEDKKKPPRQRAERRVVQQVEGHMQMSWGRKHLACSRDCKESSMAGPT